METKHTPAPWKACHQKRDTGNISICAWNAEGNESQQIALATSCDWGYEPSPDRETTSANARLIAAAPELLEALIKVREILSTKTTAFGVKHGREIIDNAINKATGA